MYRNITTEFWTDSKVEQTNCSEKLLMLYLLTAPHGNLAGCFEVTYRRIEMETGLKPQQSEKALSNLRDLGMVEYSEDTCEVLILNWGKHNWSKSPKTKAALDKQIEKVKNSQMKQHLAREYEEHFGEPYPYPIDTVSDGYEYPYISVSVSEPVSITGVGVQGEGSSVCLPAKVREIVDYLNAAIGSSYRASSKKTTSLINARLNEGFTVDDFKAVIDKKSASWKGDPKMAKYLRPETLFGTKFEGYLNEPTPRKAVADEFAIYD